MDKSLGLLFTMTVLVGQNQSSMYYSGEMNSWGATAMTYRGLGTATHIVSILSDGDDGTSEFKFRDSNANWDNSWGRGASVTFGSNTVWYASGGNGSFSETNTKYYTYIFKDVADGSNGEGYVFEFSQSPISISSVEDQTNTASTSAVGITVTLSGTPDANERVYIRYTTDNWSSSSVVEGDPSSSSIDINIPGQSAGTTVAYYAFTSITGISTSTADLATISYDNNSGNNYTYYIESNNVTISGNAGFRMMSSPVSGQIYGDLLAELWTQGMTGADVTDGTANVWTLNVSGQSWTALTDISGTGNSQTAGTGFLVYVFADNDWDGTDDLPVSLSVSGTENSSSASISSIADGNYALAGNPYASTIDWDDVTTTNLSATTSVWDDASSGWKSWNGSSGSLTNGLIAPFQGFWIQANGGTGSMTIETADKASSAGTFYRTLEDSTGSVSFTVTSANYTDQTFISFMASGEAGLDNADGTKLLPLQASQRVVGLSYTEDHALSIHNLPYENDGTISFPLDVMLLSLNESNYVTEVGDVTLSWNLDELPDHVDLTLIDNFTNTETDLSLVNTLTFSTEPKGSFSAVPDGPVGPYPVVGDPRFMLTVTYGALTHESQPTLPEDYRLHAIYPNPFNPRTMISFDLPRMSHTTIDVYDVSGRHVDQLLSEPLTPGTHHYTWSPNDLSSGIYLIQLTTGTDQFTQKVTYIK